MKAGTIVSLDSSGIVSPFASYSRKERLIRKVGNFLRIRKWAKYAERGFPLGVLVGDSILSSGIVQVRMG